MFEWADTPCVDEGMSGRGIKNVCFERQHSDNDTCETKQTRGC